MIMHPTDQLKTIKARLTLGEKCSYSEYFWPVFSRIRTGYGEIRNISPSEYGEITPNRYTFSHSVSHLKELNGN